MTSTRADAQTSLARTGLGPRGLDRQQAAAYIGVSLRMFDAMIADGRMPPPKEIGARRVWDRLALDKAFDALPDAGGREADETDDIWSRAAV